jgi:hypothetical protein
VEFLESGYMIQDEEREKYIAEISSFIQKTGLTLI